MNNYSTREVWEKVSDSHLLIEILNRKAGEGCDCIICEKKPGDWAVRVGGISNRDFVCEECIDKFSNEIDEANDTFKEAGLNGNIDLIDHRQPRSET